MTESDREKLLNQISSLKRIIADLRAANARLERQIARKEQADDEYAAAIERHIRSNILCENITEALEEPDADPDQQTAGERKWHLYFEGLYDEMPY